MTVLAMGTTCTACQSATTAGPSDTPPWRPSTPAPSTAGAGPTLTVLTVNADGSGSLRIEHWDSDEVRQTAGSSQVNISGVVSWSCQD
jgi:hypothetical protein